MSERAMHGGPAFRQALSHRTALVRAAHAFAAVLFLSIAAWFAATTLCAIANFAWRQPMFDQYRTYGMFLNVPFPHNVLLPDNGHRPIVPNLVRVAEMNWLHANQLLQITLGTALALFTAGTLALCAWRERELPLPARAAGALFGVLGVLWLGNARMLMHGNESLHAYLVTSCVACASLCTWRAQRGSPARWLGAASLAGAVATFSFGPGIATFVAVIALGALLRLPWRALLLPCAALAACLFVYVFALPGNDSVRGVLAFSPWESTTYAAQWLSAPWINGWLALADPAAEWMPTDRSLLQGRVLPALANALVGASGLGWRSLAVVIGLCGLAVFALRVLLALRRARGVSRLEALSIGLCVFALASAAVIGIGRLTYLRAFPDQVFADRYLVWPSLFWCGLALLVLGDAWRSRAWLARGGVLAAALALPWTLYATQRSQALWSEIVFREAQRTAAALRSGVLDAAQFQGNGPEEQTHDLATVDLLREHRLAMFAAPDWQRVGSVWPTSIDAPSARYAVAVEAPEPFIDPRAGTPAAHLQGRVLRGIAHLQRHGRLAVLDEDRRVAGLAEFSFLPGNTDPLLLRMPRKRGFDAYIAHYDAAKKYTLVLLGGDGRSATELATVPAPAHPAP